ncbi:Uncharacterised protein [uncultured archaeon]|nr:Uncharacterised protein [uncultured archaeon]
MADTLETQIPTDEEILRQLPPSLRQDQTVVDYVLETKHAKDTHANYKKPGQHHLTNTTGTPEEILSYPLVSCLRECGVRRSHIGYISRFLTKEELEVAMKTPLIAPTEYVYVARIRNMDLQELLAYSTEYEPRGEHSKDIHTITREWTQMERNLLAWNLGIKYNRPPTEPEIEEALMEEILKKGGSHSKKCRAFTVLAHKDWFQKKQ